VADNKKPGSSGDAGDAIPREAPHRESSKRNTSTYLETRAGTPATGGNGTAAKNSSSKATLVGLLPTDPRSPTAPGLTPAITEPASTGSADGTVPTVMASKPTPQSMVSAPAPRIPTPASSNVTLVGTPATLAQTMATRPRANTPSGSGGHDTSRDGGRSFTPDGDTIPDELNVKAAGNSRTRIGLPSITPRLFKRKDTDPGQTQTNRSGRETVLLTTVKRTPISSPTVEAVYTAPSGNYTATTPNNPAPPPVMQANARALSPSESPAVRSRARRLRPKVPPAEIRAFKHTFRPDLQKLILLSPKLVPQGAAIRSLRHRIADKGDPRVILVSSANPGEGKTFCAANLALALAEIRRSRVLLLEANVHNPDLAGIFSLKRGASYIGEIERHRHQPSDPWNVAELSTHDLHLLALDPEPETPVAVDGRHFAACLDSLRGAYDYVIVDGPPVSAGPDVSLLEDAVDGIVFVARAGMTRAKVLRDALDQISPQDLLGLVLLEE
jgi:Mrp family chromosome partitioning ATPase